VEVWNALRYGQPIAVTRAADGTLASFRWRDCEYEVAEVFSTWHLLDRIFAAFYIGK
jgi:hypothetical protein